jgi:acetyl esterase/lipase
MWSFESHPFIDPECQNAWVNYLLRQSWTVSPDLTPLSLLDLRQMNEPDFDAVADGRNFQRTDYTIAGDAPGDAVDISVISQSAERRALPVLFHLHGGGTALGNRFCDIARVLDWVDELSVAAISVEYRLSPEHPYPAGLDDAWTALIWLNAHALELSVDPRKIVLVGESAGGCLAAGLALRARDVGLPPLAGVLLMCPMLDDRIPSDVGQGATIGPWSAASNAAAWSFYLGEQRGRDDVPTYAAPGRETSLEGLPPVYIDVGSADVLAPEVIDFASRLWSCGANAELHVWPGGYHSFDEFAPLAAISVQATSSRSSWLRRIIS